MATARQTHRQQQNPVLPDAARLLPNSHIVFNFLIIFMVLQKIIFCINQTHYAYHFMNFCDSIFFKNEIKFFGNSRATAAHWAAAGNRILLLPVCCLFRQGWSSE
jgi:hypothetical protein